MTLGGAPSTPLERARHIAHLMGGNGLTTDQQVVLIAEELVKWSRADCFAAAGVSDPCNGKTPREVIEPLVWYRKDGWEHGGSAETWKDRVQELKEEAIEDHDEQAVAANAAVAALLDDMENVIDLDGSRRCILKGAIVEHFSPVLGMKVR